MWWLLSALGLSFVGWAVCSARVVLYPERRPIPPPIPLPSYTTHPLTAPDGASFDVWLLETPSPRARLLLCHGYYANRYQILGIAQGLRERGYEMVLFELRGHGGRRDACTLGVKETEDAIAVLRWARTHERPTSVPVGVLGLSMGAAVACQVALRDPAVRAVVVDSIYSRFFPVLQAAIWDRYHLSTVPWAWVTWWCLQLVLHRRLSTVDPVALAPRLHQPLFAIQGGEDRRVGQLLGQEFYERWAGPKEQWSEPGVAHVGMFTRDPQEYCDRVAGFLDRAFA